MKKTAKIIVVLFCWLVVETAGSISCAEGYEQTMAADEHQIMTTVTILEAEGSNDTLLTDLVHIVWNRPEENYEYSWRLDKKEWSAWSTDTSFAEYLDDGHHFVEVRVRETADTF